MTENNQTNQPDNQTAQSQPNQVEANLPQIDQNNQTAEQTKPVAPVVVLAKKEDRILAAIGYVPFFGLISLIYFADSAYVRLHVRQGQFIFLIYFALTVFNVILAMIGLEILGAILLPIVFLLYLTLIVYSVFQVLQGLWWKIPVIGQLSEVLPIDLLAKFLKEAFPSDIVEVKDDFVNRKETIQAENAQYQSQTNATAVQQDPNSVTPKQ